MSTHTQMWCIQQSRLPMATKTIARTLKSTTQQDSAQQLPQSSDEPRRFTGSIPFGANQLGTSRESKEQTHTTLINAFQRQLQRLGGGRPLDKEEPGDEESKPSDDEPNGAVLQDHIPIPVTRDVKPMGSLLRVFNRD